MSLRLVVAGGGTGGHLYPGLAVAEAVRARGGEVLFVGTSRGIEARAVPAAGHALELLEVSGLARMGLAGTARGLARLPKAALRARAILRSFRPDVVLGVGGYASGPVGLAALASRVPIALQEQNSVPGMTNRFLGRFARRVFLGFDDAARFFPRGRSVATGNPVRRAFVDAVANRARGELPVEPRLLVVGGSQGARAVNELVIEALARLAGGGKLLRTVHQSGAGDEARTRERYAALPWSAEQAARVDVRPFLDDMVGAYDAATLVVARAGALTLAELAVLGKPAILIPLPTAADDHQTKNAEAFARAGAAVVFSQTTGTADELAARIDELSSDRARLAAMSAAMRSLAKPNAAEAIADELAALARG